jgi:hypothetical protein
MLRLRPYPPRGTTYYLYNQKRIKAQQEKRDKNTKNS